MQSLLRVEPDAEALSAADRTIVIPAKSGIQSFQSYPDAG
jgi:hypothetical protein